jgi:hypothetical protein
MWLSLSFLALTFSTVVVGKTPATPSPTDATQAPTPAPATYPVCYICGNPDQRVTKPSLILHLPESGQVTCLQLEISGLKGQISELYCPYFALLNFNQTCGCANTLAPSPPTEAPMAPPTFAPHTPVLIVSSAHPTHRPTAPSKPTTFAPHLTPTHTTIRPSLPNRPTDVPLTSAPVKPSLKPLKPSLKPVKQSPKPVKPSPKFVKPSLKPVKLSIKPSLLAVPVKGPSNLKPTVKPIKSPSARQPTLRPKPN